MAPIIEYIIKMVITLTSVNLRALDECEVSSGMITTEKLFICLKYFNKDITDHPD